MLKSEQMTLGEEHLMEAESEGESQDQGMRLIGGPGKLQHAPRLEAKYQCSS